jgi:hypothetical protein
MKTHSTSCLIILILSSVLLCFQPAVAQTYSKQRDVIKGFKVQQGSVVQVTNKYGNINVVPWQKDSVRVEVHIKVQGKQVTRVDKIMSSIDFEIMSFGNYINARTIFQDNQATFWKDVVSYAGQVINTGNNLQIDYSVYMPSGSDLKIDNKFGNVYTDCHSGKIDIKLANGDFQGRDFSGILKLNMEFGTATIQDVNQADFVINYSDLSLNKANSLILNSRSSTFDFEKVKNLELNSQRDRLNSRECTSISGEASFSRIRITELESSASMNTKYGELKLNNVLKGFRNIRLNSEYTDLTLNLDPASAFSADITYDAKTQVSLTPAVSNTFHKEVQNPQTGKTNLSGSYGRSATSLISISTKAGSLTLFNR